MFTLDHPDVANIHAVAGVWTFAGLLWAVARPVSRFATSEETLSDVGAALRGVVDGRGPKLGPGGLLDGAGRLPVNFPFDGPLLLLLPFPFLPPLPRGLGGATLLVASLRCAVAWDGIIATTG